MLLLLRGCLETAEVQQCFMCENYADTIHLVDIQPIRVNFFFLFFPWTYWPTAKGRPPSSQRYCWEQKGILLSSRSKKMSGLIGNTVSTSWRVQISSRWRSCPGNTQTHAVSCWSCLLQDPDCQLALPAYKLPLRPLWVWEGGLRKAVWKLGAERKVKESSQLTRQTKMVLGTSRLAPFPSQPFPWSVNRLKSSAQQLGRETEVNVLPHFSNYISQTTRGDVALR